jgi:hypothetical protein
MGALSSTPPALLPDTGKEIILLKNVNCTYIPNRENFNLCLYCLPKNYFHRNTPEHALKLKITKYQKAVAEFLAPV